MNCPEYTESQDDRDYCRHLDGHSQGPVGLLLLLVALDSIYTALNKEENDD